MCGGFANKSQYIGRLAGAMDFMLNRFCCIICVLLINLLGCRDMRDNLILLGIAATLAACDVSVESIGSYRKEQR